VLQDAIFDLIEAGKFGFRPVVPLHEPGKMGNVLANIE
jgi:hypothetical protein